MVARKTLKKKLLWQQFEEANFNLDGKYLLEVNFKAFEKEKQSSSCATEVKHSGFCFCKINNRASFNHMMRVKTISLEPSNPHSCVV